MFRRVPLPLAVIVLLLAVPAPVNANGVVDPPGEAVCQVAVPLLEPRPVPVGFAKSVTPAAEGYGSLSAAGDLDGDGLDEAIERLEIYVGERSFVRLSAVDGNGATSWSRTVGHAEIIPAGNLDGVRGDDLLMMTFESQPIPGAFVQSLILTGLSGKDGTDLWTRRFDGANTGVSVGSSGSYVDSGTTYPRSLASDTNGDGAPDLLVARQHGTFIGDETSQTYTGASTVVFELVSGRTGMPISVFASPDPGSASDATAVADLSGDGLDDVVLASWPTPERSGEQPVTVAAYSGRGMPLWRSDIRTLGYPIVIGSALDGDKLSDVLVQSVAFDPEHGDPGPTSLIAISGEDGSPLWRSTLRGYVDAFPAGDATKDGGNELLTFAHEFDRHKPDGDRATVSLLRGADGRALWNRALNRAHYTPDATGDRVADVLATTAIGRGRKARHRTDLVNGASGERVWRRDGPRTEFISSFGADLNGDRAGDLALCTSASERQRYTAVSGRTGQNLWASPVEVDGQLFAMDTAALRTRGRADVLESRNRQKTNRSILTRALSGTDGRPLWQRSYPLGTRERPR